MLGVVRVSPQPVTPTTIAPEAGDTVSVAEPPASTSVEAGPMLPLGLAIADTVYCRGPSEPLQALSIRSRSKPGACAGVAALRWVRVIFDGGKSSYGLGRIFDPPPCHSRRKPCTKTAES